MKSTLQRLEAVKDSIQEAIDKGVTSVEQVHRAIADLPFAALERSGLAPEQAEAPRALVGESISAVYEAIRKVNQEVGRLATGLFESLEDNADAQSTLSRKESAETQVASGSTRKKAGKRRKA